MIFLKRLCDLFFSTLFLIVFWPFYLIVAAIIKCVSPGPAMYKAERVGNNGKVFTLYKFRSMRVDSGEIKLTTLQNDDRVFAFGKNTGGTACVFTSRPVLWMGRFLFCY